MAGRVGWGFRRPDRDLDIEKLCPKTAGHTGRMRHGQSANAPAEVKTRANYGVRPLPCSRDSAILSLCTLLGGMSEKIL